MNLLSEFFRYHTWATRQMVDFCEKQPPEMLQKMVTGTDRSILHTLTHLIGSEQEYLETLAGKQVAPPVQPGEILSLEEIKRRSEDLLPYWEEALGRLDKIDLTLPADGWWPETPHGQNVIVLQAIQHGIDHRTQICTTLDGLGLVPPRIDGWAYWAAAHRPEN